ncbi:MAG: MerR family transcriptional regulator [Coriobacteriia bacterium]|nr:MerR family transcriptional regulator [Coriobacteriia bacterium]MBN2821814.1 MerR family transcriptional regulator [Coriobacteriia bacterium]
MNPAREYMTIGEVVEHLQETFSDLSISKVRFLEEEGLVSPDRTAGGYRKFSQADLQRLELVLKLQKDNFMPLAVIREKLAEYDQGRVPAELEPVIAHTETMMLPLEDAQTVPVSKAAESLGLTEVFVRELAEFGLIELVDGDHGKEIPAGDVGIAHACWDLRRFGVEPRHLRIYETFAEREASFFSQILMPTFRHRTPEARQKLVETLGELTRLTGELKKHMLHRAISRVFEDVV